MKSVESLAIDQIKARLFDLQGHSCKGRLTIHPDGHLILTTVPVPGATKCFNFKTNSGTE